VGLLGEDTQLQEPDGQADGRREQGLPYTAPKTPQRAPALTLPHPWFGRVTTQSTHLGSLNLETSEL